MQSSQTDRASRRFQFAVLAALAASTPASAGAQDARRDTVLINETVGIRVTRPANWHTLTAAENAENIERADLPSDLKASLSKYARVPLIALIKYPEPHDDLNPSFKINIREVGHDENRSAIQILETAVAPIVQLMNGRLNGQVREVTVGGLPAAYARIDYDLRAGGKSYPTASELWIVPRGRYYFILGAGTRQDEATGSRTEIAKIVESIRFSR